MSWKYLPIPIVSENRMSFDESFDDKIMDESTEYSTDDESSEYSTDDESNESCVSCDYAETGIMTPELHERIQEIMTYDLNLSKEESCCDFCLMRMDIVRRLKVLFRCTRMDVLVCHEKIFKLCKNQ